jgi:hypothetical protein
MRTLKMTFEKKVCEFGPYREWKHQYETELVYTRKDLSEALAQQDKQNVINRVILSGKDCDVVLRIVAIHRTLEGTLVTVSI